MKIFSEEESQLLREIMVSRRDVRGNRFLNDPIEEEKLEEILMAGINAPSVGFSQPWEYVVIQDPETKLQIKESFEQENEKAKTQFGADRKDLYSAMKLEGIMESPVNIAVFYKPSESAVLGQTTMKEAGVFSVVCAIQNMWLMARALNIGMGWVSIIDPEKVKKILKAPDQNQLVGYLCLGYVNEFLPIPELEMKKWEQRKKLKEVLFYNKYNG